MIRDEATLDQFLSTISRLVNEELVPNEERVDREGTIPEEIVDALRDIGVGGLSIPEAYGGSGLTVEEKVRVAIAFGWTSPAFYRRFISNDGLGFALLHSGSEDQKREWLPKLASGACTGSFGLTEPEAGSDAGSMRTSARREGNGYVLNGAKRFITNPPCADVFMLLARTGTPEDGARGLSAFLVEGRHPRDHPPQGRRQDGLARQRHRGCGV